MKHIGHTKTCTNPRCRGRCNTGASERSEAEQQQPVVIAPEVLDVVRFLAETWSEVDAFVYKHCDGEALMHYPVVQGSRNQMNLKKIGEQQYDPARLRAGVEWLLAQ